MNFTDPIDQRHHRPTTTPTKIWRSDGPTTLPGGTSTTRGVTPRTRARRIGISVSPPLAEDTSHGTHRRCRDCDCDHESSTKPPYRVAVREKQRRNARGASHEGGQSGQVIRISAPSPHQRLPVRTLAPAPPAATAHAGAAPAARSHPRPRR